MEQSGSVRNSGAQYVALQYGAITGQKCFDVLSLSWWYEY